MNIFRRLMFVMRKGYPKEPYKMVLVVRSDVMMSKGKIAAQCAHAAVECVSKAMSSQVKKDDLNAWLLLGQPKIVVQVQGIGVVERLASKAQSLGLINAIIRDAGRTELQPNTVTALGIGPGPVSVVDKVTGHLRLL